MEVELIDNLDDFARLKSDWNSLLRRSGSDSIFLTYEWLYTYLTTIANLEKLAVIVVRHKKQIIGIAPLMYQAREGFRILYLIGHEVLDYEDIIIHPDFRDKAQAAIFEAIIKLGGWSLLQINKVRDDSPNLAGFHRFANLHNGLISDFSIAPYLVIKGEFNPYWSSLKKSFRTDIRRRKKRMQEAVGAAQYEIFNDPTICRDYFDKLIDLHIHRRQQIKGDYSFLERPERRAFYQQFIEISSNNGWLHFSCLRSADQLLALHLGFKYNRTFYYYLPTFDAKFEKYAVGYHLLEVLLHECFGNFCDEFDFLLGGEAYKYRLTKTARKLYSFMLFAPGLKGRFARLWWDRIRVQLRSTKGFMRLLPLLYKLNILKTNT